MNIKSKQQSNRKILKSIKYLVLTAAILIGATGVSNAESFTVTADVGCDPSIGSTTPATINSVTATVDDVPVSSTIDFGVVNYGFTKDIDFTIDADAAIDCANNETPGTITMDYTDPLAYQALSSGYDTYGLDGLFAEFSTDVTSVAVTFTAPQVSDSIIFSETITFGIASP